ncbi:MAG: threonine synthase [Alphaproteobacteria bacterium]|nr:threonine synthase [Alphaproteobacteria bacterium]MBU2271652.1 threonine synthase [Alphaproteobacteria bacterium]MBU2417908.1 threonine synthase [Alphaproteobacteria bacterium]
MAVSFSPAYISTRGTSPEVDFAGALLAGVAPDGGLYVPRDWPSLRQMPSDPGAAALASAVLAPFIGEALPTGALDRATVRLSEQFLRPEATPLVELSPGLFVLELFHGPTAAFKDYAMQMVAVLAEAALSVRDERLLLVTATSGDTGAAAVRAFGGVERIDLVVLHPLGRVSPVQRLQMTTTVADNVLNLAVRGDFDDCQRLVKALLKDPGLRAARRLSSVNSINWARLAGQIPYYASAARALGSEAGRATYVVPTGNFGDAFAGWGARRMGVPMAGLVAATNRNDALARALESGVYQQAPAHPTASVSMDVQAPSNFERLVFEASGRDADLTRGLFEDFSRNGRVTLPDDLLAALRREVSAVSVSEAETAQEIARTWAECGRVICPHTAVALHAARALDRSAGPVVALSTAHPAKFPEAVEAALGFAPERPSQLEGLEGRAERFETVEPTLEAVLAAIGAR